MERPGPCRYAADAGGRRPSGRSAAVPMPARLTLETDLQKYKWTGTGPYWGLLATTALGQRFSPVSGSEWPPLVFLQLALIPVHGYDIESGPGQVPEG